MEQRIDNLIKNWQRRNIAGLYCENRELAADKILEIIPQTVTVGISGSVTLDELGIVRLLQGRHTKVFNQYKPGITREESLGLRRQGALSDYYLASANAISKEGELVFFSGYGNRTAGVSYAKNLIVVCGINKITANLDEALKRAREYATPLNCKRLNWNSVCLSDGICRKEICLFPVRHNSLADARQSSVAGDYKRMCCQILIIEAEVTPDRLKVILVGESLGF